MITLHDIEQGTPAWQELRSGLYTGSNAHKLLKFGAIDYSLTETGKFRGNFWTKRGHILEEEAIGIYQQIKGTSGHRFANGRKVGFVTNSKFSGCGYSPDDLYADRTIEVKSFDEPKHRLMLDGTIPFEVLAQCHFGMVVCDKRLCDLIIYNPNLEAREAFKIITIKSRPAIRDNFKRILTAKAMVAA